MIYNGYEVYPTLLRSRATGYTACGNAVEDIHKVLSEALGDGEYLGHDEYGTEFLKTYQPLLESIWKMLESNAQGLHGVKNGLDKMAATYEQADAANTIQM